MQPLFSRLLNMGEMITTKMRQDGNGYSELLAGYNDALHDAREAVDGDNSENVPP